MPPGSRDMGEATPKRPWWRRRRWRAIAALWLALPILYVFSRGPVTYAIRRGWLPEEVVKVYRPIEDHLFPLFGGGFPADLPVYRLYWGHVRWWGRRGREAREIQIESNRERPVSRE